MGRLAPDRRAPVPLRRAAGTRTKIALLNVFTPTAGLRERLPVIVYFHGGGEEGESNDFNSTKLPAPLKATLFVMIAL